MHVREDRGFTIIEVMLVCAMAGIIYAMAVPGIVAGLRFVRLNAAARQVHSELQSARLKAVSGDRPMRIRFDCPGARYYRVVELIGTPSMPDPVDSAANRCDSITYPYPLKDTSRLTRPNLDGPPRFLPIGMSFVGAQTIEFWPDGTAHAAPGGPPWPAIVGDPGITMSVTDGTRTRSITVNGVGKIQMR